MNCNNKIIYNSDCNTLVRDSFEPSFVYVYVLQLNTTTEVTSKVLVKTTKEQSIIFNTGVDGFYTLTTIKVPRDTTQEYYYSGDRFYHLNEEISLDVLVELNPEVTGLEVTYDYYFQLCRLRECFINLCQQIFGQVSSICSSKGIDLSLTYKRDLIWSALNTIEYLVDKEEYEEALRLLERITQCNGLCNNECKQKSSSCNCGKV